MGSAPCQGTPRSCPKSATWKGARTRPGWHPGLGPPASRPVSHTHTHTVVTSHAHRGILSQLLDALRPRPPCRRPAFAAGAPGRPACAGLGTHARAGARPAPPSLRGLLRERRVAVRPRVWQGVGICQAQNPGCRRRVSLLQAEAAFEDTKEFCQRGSRPRAGAGSVRDTRPVGSQALG